MAYRTLLPGAAFFKHHLGAAMSSHPNATGSLCDPDLYRPHHRGTDCNLEERRLEKSASEVESALKDMRRQRTGNLIPGRGAALADCTVFLAEGEPAAEEDVALDGDVGIDAPGEGGFPGRRKPPQPAL